MPYLQETTLDRTIVAPSIYGNFPHTVTDLALMVEPEIRVELERFVQEYAAFLGAAGKYFRIDLYVEAGYVYIIEVNVEVADGWGVALNLLRAAGYTPCDESVFPTQFPTFAEDARQTEFGLAIAEFAQLDHQASMIHLDAPVTDELDNKWHLARFAGRWKSDRVLIPIFYWQEKCQWDSLPNDVYFKRVDDVGAKRQKVIARTSCARQNDFRQQYRKCRVIAQQQVATLTTADGSQAQAVVMCSDTKVVAGYIQVAPAERDVINDRGTKKGSLLFL